MNFDELKERYGPEAATKVSESLTLEEFAQLEIEELVAYFELRAERLYQEYNTRLENPLAGNRRDDGREAYLDILRRRWEQAEELAHTVLAADMASRQEQKVRAS